MICSVDSEASKQDRKASFGEAAVEIGSGAAGAVAGGVAAGLPGMVIGGVLPPLVARALNALLTRVGERREAGCRTRRQRPGQSSLAMSFPPRQARLA